MRRSQLSFGLVAALILAAGCKKNDAGPETKPVPPDDPSNSPLGKSVEAPVTLEAVDLSDYLIRGEMQLPVGAKFRTVMHLIPIDPATIVPLPNAIHTTEQMEVRGARGELRREGPGHFEISAGSGFGIELGHTSRTIEQVKTAMKPRVVNWVRDEPNLLVAEVKRNSGTAFEFEARVTIGSETYWIRDQSNNYSRPQIERMVEAALSLKQTDKIKAAFGRDTETIKGLFAQGCIVADGWAERTVELRGDKIADADLEKVKSLAAVANLRIAGPTKLTAKGLESLAGMRRLESLTLIGPTITDAFVAPLKALSNVTKVEIRDHALSDAGLAFLAGFKQLHQLTIHGNAARSPANSLSGTGFAYLKGLPIAILIVENEPIADTSMEHVGTLKSLQALVLKSSRITDASLKALETNKELETVALDNCPVRGGGLSTLAELPRLHTLSLNGTLVTDGALDRLRSSKIAYLGLANTSITDRGAKTLAELASLHELDLTGTRVTDACLPEFARLDHLEELRLARTNIVGATLSNFKARPSLRSLDLKDTAVTDAALAELVSVPNLEVLDLSHTATTDVGVSSLAEHKKLRAIGLSGSAVTTAGYLKFHGTKPDATITWTEAVAHPEPKVVPAVSPDKLPAPDPSGLVKKYNAQVKYEDDDKKKPVVSVSFAGSPIASAELAHLMSWKDLVTVNLGDCKGITDAALPYLAQLPALTELNLANTSVRGDGLVHLKGLAGLHALDLRGLGCNVRQMAPLAELKALERLGLEPPTDPETFGFLAGFPKLKSIDLRGLPLSDRLMAQLAKMTGLERLELTSHSIGDRGMVHFKALKNLKELRLDSDTISDQGIQNLSGLTGLKTLDLAGRRITDLGFQYFREFKELERIRVERTGLSDRGLTWFKEFSKLIELELRNGDIGDAGLVHLAAMGELEYIDLTGTRVTDEGLKHFAKLDELRKLTLDDTRVTGRGFKDIAKLPRLNRLRLARCPISDDGMGSISQVEVLEQINLDETTIADEVLGHLRILPTLKVLSLNGMTRLTDRAVDILKGCNALTEVSLRGSSVSAKAIVELKKKEGLAVQE